MAEPVGIVHVLVPGEPTEDGLPELRGEGVSAIAARPGLGESLTSEFGQAEGIVQFPEGEQPSIGGDSGPAKFQPQAAVESESKIGLWRFTRWVFHPRTSARQLSC